MRGAFTTRALGDLRDRRVRRDAAADLGLPASAGVRQVHGAGVVRLPRNPDPGATDPAPTDAAPTDPAPTDPGPTDPGADALVTDRSGLGLVVLAADCMPVLLADPGARVVGAAHAGRPGLLAGVLEATVAAMHDLGATDVVASVGPSIGGCCYELPEEMADEVAGEIPEARATTTWGTPSVDLRAGATAVLRRAGVTRVHHVGGCTHEQPARLFSHRRGRDAARQGGIVGLP